MEFNLIRASIFLLRCFKAFSLLTEDLKNSKKTRGWGNRGGFVNSSERKVQKTGHI